MSAKVTVIPIDMDALPKNPFEMLHPQERCLCAAIQMPDGYIVRGHRHDDCYMTISFYLTDQGERRYSKGDMHQAVQGFLTTTGRFVDRYVGAGLEQVAGLVSAYTKHPFAGGMLFSEDLY